ncbi:hypothetical protein [Yellowstone lake phycodnavirus 2]|jgi:hypothetical protein|uniref:hypothetical protein n=1 Tax=Yellowstone lake phycodnavirus 2 TaxID=1586714 RepID=UPI0006EB648D|nr:hypothetical protein AR678_gp196 [Yellowstone lake phycodnavirus 2]BAT22470.1 hypothetical protein [Yellowstone lake phycodnavirus 2]
MEQQILELIEEEVSRRVGLQISETLKVISKAYDLPIEQLVKDTAGIECSFCKGILKNKKRCLKVPKENGYCGFHQSQVPVPAPKLVERVKAPWEV